MCALSLDDPVFHGIADQFGDGVEIQLKHDVGAVGFCGLHAYVQVAGDLFVAFSLGKQLHNFALSRCQWTRRALALRNIRQR